MERVLPLREVARWLGIRPAEAERWTRSGELPLVRAEGLAGVHPADLKRFLTERLGEILARRGDAAEETLARRVMATLCAIERESGATEGDPAKRVLVVDDSEPSATLARQAIEAAHRGGDPIEFRRAADGVAACLVLSSERIDLAIVDLLMPNMDGIALCRLVRECVPLAATRLIVVSGLLGPATRRLLEEIGVDAALEKPFRAETLAARARALLARAPRAA